MFKHPKLKPELLSAMWWVLSAEFRDYCLSDSVLKGRTPEELIALSNNVLVKEIVVRCPFWNSCLRGACGIELTGEMDPHEGCRMKKSVALATSVAARVRNQCMSALAYRISGILFHSGATNQDFIRLNRLGVCMSPDAILGMQCSFGENFDAKVLTWKKSLEKQPGEALAPLQKIQEKQVPKLEDDDMDLDVVVDLSSETLKEYKNYKPDAFKNVISMLEAAKEKGNVAEVTDEVLKEVVCEGSKVPYYK